MDDLAVPLAADLGQEGLARSPHKELVRQDERPRADSRGEAAEVYYLEEQEGGHGASDALEHPDLMAMRLAVLFSKMTTGK